MNDELKQAVVTVGDGRGFVVEDTSGQRRIITAAHCLPFFPPCHVAAYLEERTYQNLLGEIGASPAVWAECLFADPIADIAVLGTPDSQELSRQADAYEALVESVTPIVIADAPEEGEAWLLSLDGRWFHCGVACMPEGSLWVCRTAEPIRGGMSGSPVISAEGTAIGVVNLATCHGDEDATEDKYGSPNARLTRDLPRRFLPSQTYSQ